MPTIGRRPTTSAPVKTSAASKPSGTFTPQPSGTGIKPSPKLDKAAVEKMFNPSGAAGPQKSTQGPPGAGVNGPRRNEAAPPAAPSKAPSAPESKTPPGTFKQVGSTTLPKDLMAGTKKFNDTASLFLQMNKAFGGK